MRGSMDSIDNRHKRSEHSAAPIDTSLIGKTLNQDMIKEIFKHLDENSTKAASTVSKSWNKLTIEAKKAQFTQYSQELSNFFNKNLDWPQYGEQIKAIKDVLLNRTILGSVNLIEVKQSFAHVKPTLGLLLVSIKEEDLSKLKEMANNTPLADDLLDVIKQAQLYKDFIKFLENNLDSSKYSNHVDFIKKTIGQIASKIAEDTKDGSNGLNSAKRILADMLKELNTSDLRNLYIKIKDQNLSSELEETIRLAIFYNHIEDAKKIPSTQGRVPQIALSIASLYLDGCTRAALDYIASIPDNEQLKKKTLGEILDYLTGLVPIPIENIFEITQKFAKQSSQLFTLDLFTDSVFVSLAEFAIQQGNVNLAKELLQHIKDSTYKSKIEDSIQKQE
ncbi:MAG: hypothetical protein K0S74_1085 [Chlamydiales bacterium]|jgi:hypothetical protein|nr:hypothetical protein [Chlamydiales bacterium]